MSQKSSFPLMGGDEDKGKFLRSNSFPQEGIMKDTARIDYRLYS